MTTRLGIESKFVLRILGDREWHNYTDTLARLARAVAPGKAKQRYLQDEALRERAHGPRTRPELDRDQMVASGQKTIAAKTVANLKKIYLEVREIEGVKEVRIRPDVKVPGDAGFRDPSELLPPSTVEAPEPPDPTPDTPETPEAATAPPVEPAVALLGSATGANAVDLSGACHRCGMWVANTTQHEEFHATDEGRPTRFKHVPPDVGFLSEKQLRGIVRSELYRSLRKRDGQDLLREAIQVVVADELSRFQKGMEEFLLERFIEVEQSVRSLSANGL